MDETCELLRQAWGTTNAAPPDRRDRQCRHGAAFVSTVHEGDVVVVGVNGLFGQRMCVAARCGAEVVAVEHDWEQPVDVQRMLDAHPAPALYAAVHAETSTGVRSGIAALGRPRATRCWSPTRSLHRRDRAARRRVGDRRRVRRLRSVPRCRARPRAVHDQRPGLRPPRREAPQLVPRPRLLGSYVGEASGKGEADLPPHGAGGDGRQPARGPDPDRRGGPRERLGKAPRGRPAAAGRPAGLRLELFAAEATASPTLPAVRVPASARGGPRPVARALRHRDRRRRRAVRLHRLAHRPDGPQRPARGLLVLAALEEAMKA